jgi:EAL domain-containing protein (putative c-di-GMP-specific phosphodiesterase class I)/GGDEF domain-containing protein
MLASIHYTESSMFAEIKIPESIPNDMPIPASKSHIESHHNSNLSTLREIIHQRKLSAVFQPVLNLKTGKFHGYEGLVRGPSDSKLHSPFNLFKAAAQQNLMLEIEMLSRQVVLQSFVQLDLPGKLFLNVSPETLLHPSFKNGCTLDFINKLGLSPDRVVIEITENQPTYDFVGMKAALLHYRSMGFKIAIDDLGEGFSSLRLWSELRPEFIKIDMHFVQGVDTDPVKLQFLKSIQLIAESCGTHVIAEGIETHSELATVCGLGIMLGQGYIISRPLPSPPLLASTETNSIINFKKSTPPLNNILYSPVKMIAQNLLNHIEPAFPETENEQILQRFSANPLLRAIPVIKNGMPVGLINRSNFIDHFVKPFQRELLGKKPCSLSMHNNPLLVEKNMPIEELSHFIADADEYHFNNGFIITDQGRYIGLASGQDLLRELTQMQITAARYANPLTLLPGNVPINEQIEHLLHTGTPFVACYCDLDNFKPYNDVYSYRHGDEMIQLTGRILSWACDPKLDFIGHIGGDDFILLMRSKDFQARCKQALRAFEQASSLLFKPEHLADGGYTSEDRHNELKFHRLTSLSIGAAFISPKCFFSHHQVSAAATAAKKMAKRTPGNSLFVEQRSPSCSQKS